jgi:hypothetical protein
MRNEAFLLTLLQNSSRIIMVSPWCYSPIRAFVFSLSNHSKKNSTSATKTQLVPHSNHCSCVTNQSLNAVESSWNLMAHGDAGEGKWRGTLANGGGSQYSHSTSEHDVSSITNADAQTSAASSRLNLRPRRFKWTRSFRLKTKSGFCACAITFQKHSTYK